MEVKTVEHKLRKIQITYGYNDNALTEEDEELVQGLLKAYDLQLELDEEVKRCTPIFVPPNAESIPVAMNW